jgi:hypothetical protein
MIEQAKEAYTWHAVYDDEQTVIDENAENSFAEVDQARVKTLLLLPLQGCVSHCVGIPQGAQAVFFRRRSIELNLMNEQSHSRPTVHCIGWKQGDSGVYLFIFEDGSTLLTNNLQAV